MPITIRTAQIDDIPYIFKLVKDLAIFENAPQEVTVNEQYYRKSFSEGLFESLVVLSEGQIIGICIYYDTFSTWKGKMLYLEDFFIKKEFRKNGIGQLLFQKFIEQAKDKKCTMIKWQVLDWNEPAIKFYEKNNSIIEKDWWNCKIIF